jgi:hypothetical protein
MRRIYLDKIVQTDGWVIYADVFGFTSMIESKRSLTSVLNRLVECFKRIERELGSSSKVLRIFEFSDSIFLFHSVEDSQNKYVVLQECIEVMTKVMGIFVDNKLPLRGGISFGTVSMTNNLLIGKPVVNAVTYEKLVPAPLLLLPGCECISKTGSLSLHPLAPRGFSKIELKDGSIVEAKLFYPSPPDDFVQMVDQMCRQYSLVGPWKFAQAWIAAKSYIDKWCRVQE